MTLNPLPHWISEIYVVRHPVVLRAFSNSNFEARSTKQYQMSQIQMTQTIIPSGHQSLVLVIGTFEIRICFEFRYSDFEFPAASADSFAVPVTG